MSIQIFICKFDLWLSEGQWNRTWQTPEGALAVNTVQMTPQTLNTVIYSYIPSVIVLSV